MTPVTVWNRRETAGGFAFNHLADGHEAGAKPAPKHPNHASWARGTWVREHAWLTDDMPPKVVRATPPTAAEGQP